MQISSQNKKLTILGGVFLLVYFIPFSHAAVSTALQEGLLLLSEYVREHVLFCLLPAFFIAGAISVFLNQQAVIRYFGPDANRAVAYSVASVSGSVLAVCSCTVLPLFQGIYKKGAGLGPAVSFLYSGPAINVLAIVLTAKVLGLKLGIARAVGAVLFAVIVGLLMHLIFRKEDRNRSTDVNLFAPDVDPTHAGTGKNVILLSSLVGLMLFLNWAPSQGSLALWDILYRFKYPLAVLFAISLTAVLLLRFKKEEMGEWVIATRDTALQIGPLLFAGVLVAGLLLGRPGHRGLIPSGWIASLVGGNSLRANLIASVAGAGMYFATLTEVPIMQGLIGAGMGQGPSLALLLAGPSLSLPSILVIRSVLGWGKTLCYTAIVVLLSSAAGILYGWIA